MRSLQYRGDTLKEGYAGTLNNIGSLYLKLNATDKALFYFKRSLAIKEKISDKDGICYTLSGIASVFLKLGKDNEARLYADKALALSKELGYPLNIQNASEILYSIYKKQKKSREAIEMLALSIRMRDSVNNEATRKAMTSQQFRYEYEKREMELKTEQEKKDLVHADEVRQQKTLTMTILGGSLLVAGFIIFIINRSRYTRRQKIIIEKQKQEVDKAFITLRLKNKEITDSIVYARRIQNSLLTSEKYIDRQLNRIK
jgi:tetratricopeptide (TPR) repeat protein